MVFEVSKPQRSMILVFAALIWLCVLIKPVYTPIEFLEFAQPLVSTAQVFERLALPTNSKMVHASFIEQLPDNRQVIFWFGGSREGHKDVQIYRTVLREGKVLVAPEPVLSAPMLSELSGRYIKKLGNPVAKFHDGKLFLWVVSVSVGGWATAKVDMLVSNDEGKTFLHGEKLNTSPFFNVSNLVRNPLVETKAGFLLPAYFELNRLDPVMVRLGRDMRMLNSQTLPMDAIQPIVIPNLDGSSAQLYARPIEQNYIQKGLWQPTTAQWHVQNVNALPNDSSDSAAIRLSTSEILMVHNGARGRGQLLVSLSEDNGKSWRPIKTLEDQAGERYSYPTLLLGPDGMIHLTYTWQREHIQYLRFSLTALKEE